MASLARVWFEWEGPASQSDLCTAAKLAAALSLVSQQNSLEVSNANNFSPLEIRRPTAFCNLGMGSEQLSIPRFEVKSSST